MPVVILPHDNMKQFMDHSSNMNFQNVINSIPTSTIINNNRPEVNPCTEIKRNSR